MDAWSRWFATPGIELDGQDALVALERVLGRSEIPRTLRDRLQEAAAALRQLGAQAREESSSSDELARSA